jgi:hypothetical protein
MNTSLPKTENIYIRKATTAIAPAPVITPPKVMVEAAPVNSG